MVGKNTAIFCFYVFPHKIFFFINLKCITVTWLFKMTKFMWAIFNSLCRPSCLYLMCIQSHWDLKVHQLYEFAICTTWLGGNVVMKDDNWFQTLGRFTGMNFPDLNPNSYEKFCSACFKRYSPAHAQKWNL